MPDAATNEDKSAFRQGCRSLRRGMSDNMTKRMGSKTVLNVVGDTEVDNDVSSLLPQTICEKDYGQPRYVAP